MIQCKSSVVNSRGERKLNIKLPGDEVPPSQVLGHQDGVERGLKEADQLHHEGRLDQGTKNLSLATNFPFLLVGFSIGKSYM